MVTVRQQNSNHWLLSMSSSEEQTVHPFAVFFRTCRMCRNSPFKDQCSRATFQIPEGKPQASICYESLLASKDREKKANARYFPSLSEGTVQEVSLGPSPHIVHSPEATTLPGVCASHFFFLYRIVFC